jgi:VWFA-related protein
MRLRCLLLTLAVCGAIPLAAQVSQPPVFRAGTDLVEVEVIARDKSGMFVSDLTLDDFELQEDGKPYPVQQVYLRLAGPAGSSDTLRNSSAAGNVAAPAPASASTEVHRVFVIVFDDAHLSAAGFKRTQAAAQTLFQSQLRDGDIGGVVSNGRMANGRLTSNRAELIKAAKDAKPGTNVMSVEMDERLWPRLSEVEAVRIAVNEDHELFDMATRRACDEDRSACQGPAGDDPVRGMIRGKAIQMSTNVRVGATRTLAMLQSVLSGLSRLEGPKNVLLMTEGFVSEETWPDVKDAVSAAARANTRIYTLDARGLGRKLGSVDSVAPADPLAFMYEQMDLAADSVNSLAVDTGGFVVRNTNQFDRAIAQIADDAGNYYVLGYLPPSPADGKFHRIRVKIKRPDINLRSRRGYTATPRPRPIVTATPAAVASAVASGISPTEPTTEPDASSVGLPPSRAERASASLAVASGGGGKPDTTEGPDTTGDAAGAAAAVITGRGRGVAVYPRRARTLTPCRFTLTPIR